MKRNGLKKNKPSVEYWFYVNSVGKYFLDASDFSAALSQEFLRCLKDKEEKNAIYIQKIKLAIENGKSNRYSIDDILQDIFRDNVVLNYNFAKSLNLFDIVYLDCFVAKNRLGQAMIELCKNCSMIFLVSHKMYQQEDRIEISLEVCTESNHLDCHRALVTQSIYQEHKRKKKKKETKTFDFNYE